VRCLRPDALSAAARHYVLGNLGKPFVEPPSVSLARCFQEATATVPLLFMLTAGADPTQVSKHLIMFERKLRIVLRILSRLVLGVLSIHFRLSFKTRPSYVYDSLPSPL
jgi:hypothetical protein